MEQCTNKPCKECPWVVNNSHNKKFTDFIKKSGKKHNCHMLTKDIYDVNGKQMCNGQKQYYDNKI